MPLKLVDEDTRQYEGITHLQRHGSYWGIIVNGIFGENTVFRLVLSLCPTVAVTNSLRNGFILGVAVLFVQIMVNVTVSALRKFIHPRIRIPIYMFIIAGWVTVIDMLMAAYARAAYAQIGLYIQIIVAYASIFARAELVASKNKVVTSLMDGIGMGVGYVIALVIISFFRELLGRGSLWGWEIIPTKPLLIMILPTGGFLVIGILIAFFNWIDIRFFNGKGASGAPSCH
jgi:electron transport complex protein RnfE